MCGIAFASISVFCLFFSVPRRSLVEEAAGDSIRVVAQIRCIHFPAALAFSKEALVPLFRHLTLLPTLKVLFS